METMMAFAGKQEWKRSILKQVSTFYASGLYESLLQARRIGKEEWE
jgi:hypothetical protein